MMGGDVEKNAESQKEITDFTDIIGGSGPWQRFVYVVYFFVAIASCWHILAMSFLAPNVNYWCAKNTNYGNISTYTEKQYANATANGNFSDVGQCYIYEVLNTTTIISDDESNNGSISNKTENSSTKMPCHKWVYDDSSYVSTVVSQWDLVCYRSWMVSLSNSVSMAGFLLSVFLLGQLSDKIGRRPVIMGSTVVLVISGVICAFSISFIMFTVARFFVVFGAAGVFNTAFTFIMEVVGMESRSTYGIAVQLGWSTGYVLLPGIAWLIRDWFWLQLAITLPCIVITFLWWVIPESPRWLFAHGKIEKAEKIVLKIAEANKKNVQDVSSSLKKLWIKSPKDHSTIKKSNILDLFTPGLWQKSLNMFLCWFVNSFIYYGLSFHTNDLAGDPFVNFAIAGAVEFPAYLLTILVMRSFGRRIPLMAAMVAGGISCLLTVSVTDDLAWVRMPLAMFGKFCITASFGIIYLYSAEIFPTVVRNTGIGMSSTCARIGSILAPFVKELGKFTHPAVPFACYGILSIFSGLLVLLLPETNHCKVPDTLEEAVACGRPNPEPTPTETPQVQKPCLIHDGTEKDKPSSPKLRGASDGKKLPDLLEEPSVMCEVVEDNVPMENHCLLQNNPEMLAPEEPKTPEFIELPETAPEQEELKEMAKDSSADSDATEPPPQQTPL